MKKNKSGHEASITATHLLLDTATAFFAPLIPLKSEKPGFTYALAGALLSLLASPPARCMKS